ncbi:MAG: hypothetical protein SWO11_18350 [Thermodesulfobacteriota bacterium]|nr:hypothetical protein [Thermodesulfobacteriota bacterium]
MKKTKFSEVKIVAILKKAEAGIPNPELVRKYGIRQAALYN